MPLCRNGYTIFCDDVRMEAGNKLSLMGIYRNQLYVPSFPFTLIKLCLVINVRTPADQPFKELKYKILHDDEEKTTLEISPDDLGSTFDPPEDGEEYQQTHQAVLTVHNLKVEKPMKIMVRAETPDGEIKAGALLISMPEEQLTH